MEITREIKVLIVEENETDYSQLVNHLKKLEDFKVSPIACYSYEDAVIIYSHMNIDVCFLKGQMHHKSGVQFLKKLKERRKETPIILIYNESPDEGLLADEGVNDYVLRKNFSPEVLNKSIRHAIENNENYLQLLNHEEKYSKLFYSSLEAVFVVNAQYEILECNKGFMELFKINDLSQFDFKSLFVGENSYESLYEFSKLEKRKVRKTKFTNKNGEEIIAYFSLTTISSETAEDQFLGIIHDITELENAQAKLAEADKLELIQRMARIIGHEVRNPLTNIFLAAEELKQDLNPANEKDADALDMLDMIERNSSRISSLIDNFLKNARKVELEKDDCVLEEVVAKSINTCLDRIVLKSIDLKTEGVDSQTRLMMDSQKVSIALTNILINAIEALETVENPRLEVSLVHGVGLADLIIEDNGIGMSEETKANLFTPFFSNKQGGLGLGMANSYGILKAHKAKVKVDSELNQGTRFTISFAVEA